MAVVEKELEQAKTQSEPAWEIYYRLRDKIETPENIGKLIIIDANGGDYEIADDDLGLAQCRRLRKKNLKADLFALRIGYKTTASFCGDLERLP